MFCIYTYVYIHKHLFSDSTSRPSSGLINMWLCWACRHDPCPGQFLIPKEQTKRWIRIYGQSNSFNPLRRLSSKPASRIQGALGITQCIMHLAECVEEKLFIRWWLNSWNGLGWMWAWKRGQRWAVRVCVPTGTSMPTSSSHLWNHPEEVQRKEWKSKAELGTSPYSSSRHPKHSNKNGKLTLRYFFSS